MKLNLGCANDMLQGWLNVDAHHFIPPAGCDFQQFDLRRPMWPWPESSVAEIRAVDIIEHLPDKIQTMNQCWRVLEPGGKLDIVVPTTDGPGAWQDPQHCSYWNRNSFLYYTDGAAERERFHEAYGIVARFKVLSEKQEKDWRGAVKLSILLEAVK